MRPLISVNVLYTRLPKELVERFCRAIGYARKDRRPTPHERVELELVLEAIARTAHNLAITPERVLIQLKVEWTRVCHRDPSPDMHDPLWSAVVRAALAAYERARREIAAA
jgi:hypothetical protein